MWLMSAQSRIALADFHHTSSQNVDEDSWQNYSQDDTCVVTLEGHPSCPHIPEVPFDKMAGFVGWVMHMACWEDICHRYQEPCNP